MGKHAIEFTVVDNIMEWQNKGGKPKRKPKLSTTGGEIERHRIAQQRTWWLNQTLVERRQWGRQATKMAQR